MRDLIASLSAEKKAKNTNARAGGHRRIPYLVPNSSTPRIQCYPFRRYRLLSRGVRKRYGTGISNRPRAYTGTSIGSCNVVITFMSFRPNAPRLPRSRVQQLFVFSAEDLAGAFRRLMAPVGAGEGSGTSHKRRRPSSSDDEESEELQGAEQSDDQVCTVHLNPLPSDQKSAVLPTCAHRA